MNPQPDPKAAAFYYGSLLIIAILMFAYYKFKNRKR